MPDNNKYPFSKEKQEKAIKWLEEKWKNKQCECCGENDWEVLDHLVTPVRYDESGISLSNVRLIPQIIIVCINCGYTKYFNSVIMGIVDSGKKRD